MVLETPGDDRGIELRVLKILSDYLLLDNIKITRDTYLVEELHFDSMNIIEIVMMLNDAFIMELPHVCVVGWERVVDIISSVVMHVNVKFQGASVKL